MDRDTDQQICIHTDILTTILFTPTGDEVVMILILTVMRMMLYEDIACVGDGKGPDSAAVCSDSHAND